MVEGLRGHRYDKPIPAMRAYLDGIHTDLPEGEEPPVMVAALGPKMLALSAEQSRGAVALTFRGRTPRQNLEVQTDVASVVKRQSQSDASPFCRGGALVIAFSARLDT